MAQGDDGGPGIVVAAEGDHTYPSLYVAADTSSLEGQRHFLLATRLRLHSLVVAAVGGGFSATVGRFDLFGVAGFVALTVALATEIYVLSARPDRLWYEGRAAAESVKTLAWRYMVGGEPFSVSLPDDEADQAFLARLGEILHDLDELDLTPDLTTEAQITAEMRRVRAAALTERQRAYRRGRIDVQRVWYSRRAAVNRRLDQRWSLATVTLEAGGVIAASAKAFGVVDVDLLGLVAAAAAAITAWSQAKQHGTLSHSYFVASQELATISTHLERSFSEPQWARFVDEAEEAVSREHTLWRASRGTPLRSL